MDFGDSSSAGDTPLSLVMQFLHESGYDDALKALEAERYFKKIKVVRLLYADLTVVENHLIMRTSNLVVNCYRS